MKNVRQLITIVAVLLSLGAWGQQDIQFTQYFDNTLAVNPAYAGSNGMLNATAIHREQWVGMDGRPRSTTFSVHSPLNYENVGLGFSAVNDVVGPIQQTSFFGDFSYTLRFKNSNAKLSFGLKAGLNLLSSRTDLLTTTDAQDPNLITNVRNQMNPNFGAGIYYHTPNFFLGLSTPKILEHSLNGASSGKVRRHYFMVAGGVFNLTQNQYWKLRPTTMLKFTSGAPLSIDLSTAVIYRNKLWLGLTYRWADSFGAFVQYQITDQFRAGLAYDQTVTDLSGFNKGTYEVMLSYDFVFNKQGIRSPRYF